MKLQCWLVITLLLSLISCAQEKTVWLDELDLSAMTSGWGTPKINQSVLGYTMQMSGAKFRRGVGVHAESKYMLQLGGKATEFSAVVGVDDTGKDKSSVIFYLLGDQEILWQSPLLRKGEYREVKVDLKDIEIFAIYVSDGGDGYERDYANIARAQFKTNGSIENYSPAEHPCEIWMPKSADIPAINGPSVIGVRPNAPLLYRLPVSGSGEMKFRIKDLPKGIKFNKESRILSGSLDKKGTYEFKVQVRNVHGSDERDLSFVVGDQISLTPPMGWNSWNVWGADIDQEKIKAAGEALISSGLADYGWSYVVIDDGWQGNRMNKNKSLQPNEKFEDLETLIDDVHKMGLKFGLYSTPWITSFAGFCGTSSDSEDGYWSKSEHGSRSFTKMGEFRFEAEDVQQYVDWEIDYLKYDWNPIDRDALVRMGKEIKNASRDIVLSISNSGKLEDIDDYMEWANLWRTTSDIRDIWDNDHPNGKNAQGIMDIYRFHTRWQKYNKPGNWNDPDMLVLGEVGWGEPRPNRLHCYELYTHFTLWSMWSSPLMLGCDLTSLDPLVKSILTNPEVISINQDALGIQAELIFEEEGISIFKKPLADGSWAVAVLNRGNFADTVIDRFDWGPQPGREIEVSFEQLSLTGAFEIRDLWRRENMGIKKDNITLDIPHHGVSLLKFKKVE